MKIIMNIFGNKRVKVIKRLKGNSIEVKGKSKNLKEARKKKMDEFYTQLSDVEKELDNYRKYFIGKVIFCNCDDPETSNFWAYFHLKFKDLGLKKLISTHYDYEKPTYKLEYTGGDDNNIKAGIRTNLIRNGDFRDQECIELLKEADIVVTNPPFSLFREYVYQLIEYGKNFIIIGNQNAITYKEFFPLLQKNKIWLGCSIHSGDREFRVPNYYPLNAAGCRVDEEGNKYIRIKGVRWFTNLDYNKRHEKLICSKYYNPESYPKYDNYNAINVDKTKDIPRNYNGVMGVPITFLDKYNPDQFELLGIMNTGEVNKGIRYENTPHGRPIVNGKELYLRVLIRMR
jgi:hypothetical protein